jgi:hypothetical protein
MLSVVMLNVLSVMVVVSLFSSVMLGVAFYRYAECSYAECLYAECRGFHITEQLKNLFVLPPGGEFDRCYLTVTIL